MKDKGLFGLEVQLHLAKVLRNTVTNLVNHLLW